MRRTLQVTAILSMLFGGAAFADHYHGGHEAGHGPVVRDHRGPSTVVVRDHRGGGPVIHEREREHERGRERVVEHVRVENGRYMFPGGVVRVYHRPVIREHYYDMHRRPAMIVESYDPVPGYAWVRGGWTWGGSEWMWTPGYWSPAAEPAAPVVEGGVSVSAGIHL